MKHSLGGSIAKWFTNLIRNSKYRWLIILGSLVYLISPLDISPDVFPIIGWIDDGLLASIVVTELTQMVLEQRRKKETMQQQSPSERNGNSVIDVESATVS
ncbi:MAG: YkvA family protein [Cyanobacteria bacterium P01_F01_bin.86]